MPNKVTNDNLYISNDFSSFIPEWMKSSSSYNPSADKEGFISSSMKSFLAVLSKIKRNSVASDVISSEIKIIFTLLNIILVSLSHNIAFTYFIFGICILHMVFMNGEALKGIFRTAFAAAFLSMLFLIPSVFFGNYKNIILIIFKVFSSIIIISILTHSTSFSHLTKAFHSFFVPDVIIFLLDITVKYIYILGDTCMQMLEALKLRSVGINHSKEKSASGILGIAYIKSREMSIATYDAMICRCFDGEYNQIHSISSSNSTGKTIIYDILYGLLMFGILYMFFGPLR